MISVLPSPGMLWCFSFPKFGSRQCGSQFFLLCPAMGCVTWVRCVNRNRVVQAVEVGQNCRRETCARVKLSSHPVREKMS